MYMCNPSADKGLRPSWCILWTNDPSLLIRVAFLGLFRAFSPPRRGFRPICQVKAASIRGRWNWPPRPNIRAQLHPPPNVAPQRSSKPPRPSLFVLCSKTRCLLWDSTQDDVSKRRHHAMPCKPMVPQHWATRQCPPRPGPLPRGARKGGRCEAIDA